MLFIVLPPMRRYVQISLDDAAAKSLYTNWQNPLTSASSGRRLPTPPAFLD
jgi:hypothetical protein